MAQALCAPWAEAHQLQALTQAPQGLLVTPLAGVGSRALDLEAASATSKQSGLARCSTHNTLLSQLYLMSCTHCHLSTWPCIITCAVLDDFASIVLVLSEFVGIVPMSSAPWLSNACFKPSTAHGTSLSPLGRHLHDNLNFPLPAASTQCIVCLPEPHTSCGCIWCCTTLLCCVMLICAMLDSKAPIPFSQCTAPYCMPSACPSFQCGHCIQLTNLTLVIHSTAVESQATANTIYNVCSSMPKPLKMSSERPLKYLAQWWAALLCGRPTVPTLTLRKLSQPQEQEGP